MKDKIILILTALVLSSGILYAKPHAYPNPWIPASPSGENGTLTDGVTITELPDTGGTIYIYNSTGELVRKFKWESGTDAVWDGKNDSSEYVASGVYIWVTKDAGTKSGKIVVIR